MKAKDVKSEDLRVLNAKTRSVPLRGFITRDDKDSLWIEDRGGTWVVQKEDIVAEDGKWNVNDPRFQGKPVCLFIRDGAELHELRPTTIDISERPITLGDPREIPKIVGDAELTKLAELWSRHLGFKPGTSAEQSCTPWTTACCYDTGDFGTDCQADDSSCD